MRVFHSVVIREKPTSKRPRKHSKLYSLVNKTLGENTNFNGTDYCATELYSSGEQNAAFSYIILRFTYIRGLIMIGRGSSDWCVELSGAVFSMLDFCVDDPGSIPAGAEFPTGIQFWVMT